MNDIPSSFCSLATEVHKEELDLMLSSIALFHKKSKVFCLVDTKTFNFCKNAYYNDLLEIVWLNTLDNFSGKTRKEMETDGSIDSFWDLKTVIMELALKYCPDTLYLDADCILLQKIIGIDKSKLFGLSPHRIPQKNCQETGYYNAGFVWSSSKKFAQLWRQANKTSDYGDQKSLETLALNYVGKFFEFDDSFNLMPWTSILNDEIFSLYKSRFTIIDNVIYYNFKPLKSVHTHIRDSRFIDFNSLIIKLLKSSGNYRLLTIIEKSIAGHWNVTIPSQPRNDIYHHNNDSFRELAALSCEHEFENNLQISRDTNFNHCHLGSYILLYDRPTLEWAKDIEKSDCKIICLGNGDIKDEGKYLSRFVKTVPWIFWPRNPKFLNNYIKENRYLPFEDRSFESCFIGNIENSTQEKHRNAKSWQDYIEFFSLTNGSHHKYTQSQYFDIYSKSKFGLCLQGYGKKCHREIECMAVGTVPVVMEDKQYGSFVEPLEENVHYIKIKNPDDMKKLANLPKASWELMSDNCLRWYNANCSPSNWLNTTLKSIL